MINARNQLAAFVIALAMAALVVNPAAARMGQHEGQGTAIGSILGGLIGGAIGGSAGRAIVGSVAGAVVGGLIGNRIGAQMDKQDRLALERATRTAFRSGRSQRFARRGGARGRVRVVRSHRSHGEPCRTVQQHVVLKTGRILNDTVSACRGPHGRWQV